MTHGRASSGAAEVSVSVARLASQLAGEPEGDGEKVVTGIAGLAEAGPDDISFVSSARYIEEEKRSRAGAVIAPRDLPLTASSVVRVANPHLAFAKALEIFHPRREPVPGVHPTACVEEGASVSPSAAIGPFCHVSGSASVGAGSVVGSHCVLGEGSSLGEDVLLHPRVCVLAGVEVGDRTIIHSGAVLGSDGYGYVHDGGRHHKIPQVGRVVIEDDVEIGANVTIDRATTGATRVGAGTKIDNLVQIAHNVVIGPHCLIISQVGISGSTRIGEAVVLGGQVGIVGHVTVEDGAVIGAQSGVINDVPAGETRSGMGPLPHRDWLKAQAAFEKLPQFRKRLKALENNVARLEAGISADSDPSGGPESS